jgi:hypothetical protein
MRIALSLLLFFLASTVAVAQSYQDKCHVYVVDVAAARKAGENFRETGNEEADIKALSVGQTVFPEFITEFREEQLTTRHYPFPGSKLIITSSVYYTDESLASDGEGRYEVNDQSMVIGVSVSNKGRKSALSDNTPNSSIAEVTLDQHLHTARAKQYVRIGKRSYLVGIECARSKTSP